MLRSITIQSYAKVNYTLDVLSLRPDGFHGIASVMQTVSLADTIRITRTDNSAISLECSDAAIPSDDSNLAWRAAEADRWISDAAASYALVVASLDKSDGLAG